MANFEIFLSENTISWNYPCVFTLWAKSMKLRSNTISKFCFDEAENLELFLVRTFGASK